MCCHCIIRDGSAFFALMQIAFVYFEKDFDIPSFSIDADDLIFIQFRVRGNNTQVLFAFISVTDINYFGRNDLSVFYNINHNG